MVIFVSVDFLLMVALVACRFSWGGCGDRSLLAGTWGLVVICVLVLLKASTSQRSSPRPLGDVPSASEDPS